MKLIIKTPKPRNPHAIAAKQRNAGAHGSHQASRLRRRAEKQHLHMMLSGRDPDNDINEYSEK